MCDSFGRKMSKSLGNVITPGQIINGASMDDLQNDIENSVRRGIIDNSEREKSLEGQRKLFSKTQGIPECGVDALRFTICSQNIKQHFISFDVSECLANKLFFNKLWQATKYAINYAETNLLNIREVTDLERSRLTDMDLWILSRLGSTIKVLKHSIENYNFHQTTAALKTFLYNDFCDVYLETTKVAHENHRETAKVLSICLAIGLRYMSIFTPYLADELLQHLPAKPVENIERDFSDGDVEQKVTELIEVCKKIRELKTKLGITKKLNAEICILAMSEEQKLFFVKNHATIKHLTFTEEMRIITNKEEFKNEKFAAISTATHACSLGIKTMDLKEMKASNDINSRKKLKLEQELSNMLSIVNNKGYREKANEKVQKSHLDKVINLF